MKTLFPLLILSAASMAYWVLIELSPEPKAKEIIPKIPFVETFSAEKQLLQSTVFSYGVVKPRTRSTLIAEVPGIVNAVAPFSFQQAPLPTFRTGGFFQKGDLLLSIEDTALKTKLAEARANLSRTSLQLIQEKELQKQAKIEWGDRDWNQASDLVKRVPQIEKAEAEMRAAAATFRQAEIDLSRASVKSPFEGRILRTMVDIGQRVGSGTSSVLAEIYSLDFAEIDLSLSKSQLNFLGFIDGGSSMNSLVELEVLDENGKVLHYGTLERSEGIMDSKTRLTKLVALVSNCFANPYSNSPIQDPLTIGQFVNLKLSGQKREVFVIPDSAFRTEDSILVVDDLSRLQIRKVTPIYRFEKEVWVTTGLREGEMVCLTPIEVMSEGMEVRQVNQSTEESNQTEL